MIMRFWRNYHASEQAPCITLYTEIWRWEGICTREHGEGRPVSLMGNMASGDWADDGDQMSIVGFPRSNPQFKETGAWGYIW